MSAVEKYSLVESGATQASPRSVDACSNHGMLGGSLVAVLGPGGRLQACLCLLLLCGQRAWKATVHLLMSILMLCLLAACEADKNKHVSQVRALPRTYYNGVL